MLVATIWSGVLKSLPSAERGEPNLRLPKQAAAATRGNMERSKRFHLAAPVAIAAPFAIAALLALRIALLPASTPDQFTFLLPWIVEAGHLGPSYLRHPFTNYPPFYEHVLAGLALLPGPALARIKLFSIVFDFALAAAVARLVPSGRRLVAFVVVLALPTVIVNSAMLGQSDSVYAAFVVLALGFTIQDRPVAAMLMMSVALAVKLQALMFMPFLLLMALQRRHALWTFALLPVAYVALAIPMLVAGRPVKRVILVYPDQFEALQRLSLNAPNAWAVLQKFVAYSKGLAFGLPFAIAVVGAAILLLWRSGIARSREGMLLSAAILLILGPYVTPKMHDRFFFLVDPVLVALACTYRGYLAPMLLAQFGSACAYVPFISRTYGNHSPLFGEGGWLQRHFSIGWGAFLLAGVISMSCALVALLLKARTLTSALARDPSPALA